MLGRTIRISISTVILTITLLFSTTFAFAADLDSGDKAKVNAYFLNVRIGAGVSNSVSTVIAKDTEVTVLAAVNDWYKVKLAGGKEGYVYGKYLTASVVLPTLKAVAITDENFSPFGRLVYDTEKVDAYEDDNLKWIAEIDFLKGYSDLSVNFLRNNQRAMVVDTLEIHMQTEELFVPMNESPAILVVAPSGQNVDLMKDAKAFYIEPGIAYLFNKGVPHWITYPTTEKPAEYCVITTTGTGSNDTTYVKFSSPMKVVN